MIKSRIWNMFYVHEKCKNSLAERSATLYQNIRIPVEIKIESNPLVPPQSARAPSPLEPKRWMEQKLPPPQPPRCDRSGIVASQIYRYTVGDVLNGALWTAKVCTQMMYRNYRLSRQTRRLYFHKLTGRGFARRRTYSKGIGDLHKINLVDMSNL